MKIGRNLQSAEPDSIQLAPLIDIVFLVLVVYMTAAAFTELESEIDVVLPTATQAETIERHPGEIYINLMDDGRIVVNKREYALDELQDLLIQVAQYFPGGGVIIRGDRNAQLGNAIAVLDACKNADIQNVSFAALQPGVARE